MGFEAVLRRRLGPLQSLVPGRRQSVRPPFNELWFRRAVGLELTLRSAGTHSIVRPARIHARRLDTPEKDALQLTMSEATRLLDLNVWTRGTELDHGELARWLDAHLIYWAEDLQEINLPATHLPKDWDGLLARRPWVWPTLAVETPTEIRPMPFMPRGRDLDGAELIGLRLTTLHRGHEIQNSTLLGDAQVGPKLRELIPLLNGRRRQLDIENLFSRSERQLIRNLLDILHRVGALEAVETPPEEPFITQQTQLTWLGHAAVLIQAGGHSILVDPLFHAQRDVNEKCPDPRRMPKIDAVLITHGDNDHLSPSALSHLPVSTPIYFPAVRPPPPPHQVDMEGMLRVLGFRNLRPLEPFTKINLGPFNIESLPFDGEDWGLEQAQLTYLVEGPNLSVFLSADSLGPRETYQYLAHKSVDVAFMGISGSAEPLVGPPGFGYGNFYAQWIPADRRDNFVRHTAGPKESAEFCKIFNPRFAFGYAAGGGSPWMRTEYADYGSHETFAAELSSTSCQAVAFPLGCPVLPSELTGLPPY